MSTPNFNSEDFYEVLGVQSSSDDKAIKKAYRKLSLKYHPDKNPDNKQEAEEIFKKISYAYGILSDQQKRKDYDRYGRDYVENGGARSGGGGGGGFSHQGFSSGHNFQHFNMQSADEIFKQFFGGKDPFANFFDDDDDFFGGGFGSMGMQMRGGGQKGSRKNRDPFGGMGMGMGGFDDDDDFFGGGFGGGMQMMSGGGGGFSSFQSSSFGMGGGGMGESISQSTVIENGRQKTVTKKTKIDSQGNRTTEITEEFQDPRTGE